MKNSILGKKVTVLRSLFASVIVPVLAFIFFSSAAAAAAASDSEVLFQDFATITHQDSNKLIGFANLMVDENEKEETEEKNHSDDQKKLENAKVFVPTVVLQFIPIFKAPELTSSVGFEEVDHLKIPLYIAFHSWKTFC